MTFKEKLKTAGISRQQFMKETGTPGGTIDCWLSGQRKAPPIAFWAVEQLGKETETK